MVYILTGLLWSSLPAQAAGLTLTGPEVLLAERANVFAVVGPPTSDVALVAYRGPPGGPPVCPAVLAPECLEVAGPVRVVAQATLSTRGFAELTVQPPRGVVGSEVQLQAASPGPVGRFTSSALSARVLSPAGDEDADGLSNELELTVLGTAWDRADSDRGGTDDLTELLYGTDPLDDNDDLFCFGVEQVVPSSGAVGVSTVAPLYARLGRNLSGETFWLEGGGVEVPARVELVEPAREQVWVWPEDPLLAGTSYVLRSTMPCAPVVTSFTTGPAHVPADPASLVGRAWRIDALGGGLVSPSGAAALLPGLQSDFDVAHALALEGWDPVTSTFDGYLVELETVGALAQEACTPTVELPGIAYDPVFGRLSFEGVVQLPGDVGAFAVTLSLTAHPVSAATVLEVDRLGVVLDFAEPSLLDGLGLDNAGQMCTLIETFGLLCERCGATGRQDCLPLSWIDPPSPELGFAVAPSQTFDPAVCPTPQSWCGASCAHGGGFAPWGFGILLLARRRRR